MTTSNRPDVFPPLPFVSVGDGVEMRILRRHQDRGMTFLIRMRHGSVAPLHDHPGGEETYVIEGQLRIRNRVSAQGVLEPDVVLRPGDYVFAPPGEKHDGTADGDTLFLVVAPGGVARAG